MLRTRVMPSLLLKNGGLVKTVRFTDDQYVGDPLNAVRIYNQKEVDELVVYDISKTTESKGIDFDLIEKIASQCFMPVCYGGGVKSLQDFKALFSLGVEKVSVSSLLFDNPEIVRQAIDIFGSQSIIATVDLRKPFLRSKYIVKTHSGTVKRSIKVSQVVHYCESLGIGEIVINNINQEGTWDGFDIDLLKIITANATVPVVALGGAGSLEDIRAAVYDGGASAVCIGSMAVFQSKGMGVLIKFPKLSELEKVFGT
jgi:imidazole glycerol-phosphate synthase subunit HisF